LLLYYITDRTQFPGDEASRRQRLLETIAHAARCGVDYIQLREKDLSIHELETLARDVVRQLRTANPEPATGLPIKPGLLINSRTDIAFACGASGVHLRSADISPVVVRKIWTQCGVGALAHVTVGSSCHTRAEVARAAEEGADFAVFGPVFDKRTEKRTLPHTQPGGLDALHEACREKIPVLALGAIALENAVACIQAGASGVAGIRLFQEDEMHKTVGALRRLEGRQSPAVRPLNPKADD
jgi:thiamine-phosphate pyrophosphorylase